MHQQLYRGSCSSYGCVAVVTRTAFATAVIQEGHNGMTKTDNIQYINAILAGRAYTLSLQCAKVDMLGTGVCSRMRSVVEM